MAVLCVKGNGSPIALVQEAFETWPWHMKAVASSSPHCLTFDEVETSQMSELGALEVKVFCI